MATKTIQCTFTLNLVFYYSDDMYYDMYFNIIANETSTCKYMYYKNQISIEPIEG